MLAMTYLLVSMLVLAALATAAMAVLAGALPASLDDEPGCGGLSCTYAQAHARWHALGQARDWESLQMQVRRWQAVAAPGWSESEIEQVARSLNQAVFRFMEPAR